MKSSTTRRLSVGPEIRIVTAPYFLATKLEAFKGRGKGDFLGSHDLEDFVSVVDGREALLLEIREETRQSRISIVLRRLEDLASSADLPSMTVDP